MSGLDNVRALIALDAAQAPRPVERADAVICINMIHFLPGRRAALSNMPERFCRPARRSIFMVPTNGAARIPPVWSSGPGRSFTEGLRRGRRPARQEPGHGLRLPARRDR
ncbi:hypothetical protein [Methylocystis echinoides]|uniref:hypothetical protein n=1 Tax=Methylocystis echinoides TaxID=29468 RepID=UPI00341406BD